MKKTIPLSITALTILALNRILKFMSLKQHLWQLSVFIIKILLLRLISSLMANSLPFLLSEKSYLIASQTTIIGFIKYQDNTKWKVKSIAENLTTEVRISVRNESQTSPKHNLVSCSEQVVLWEMAAESFQQARMNLRFVCKWCVP